eukprot:Sspe_Gene.90864::Locus_62341_Transcript_1_2_Confidence_0.500_Length_1179::g.90864::m.90864
MDTSICRHWQRGRCRLGDRCKFKHPETGWGSNPGGETPVMKKSKWCRHERLDDCRFNGGCVYWHLEEWEALPPDERPIDLPPPPRSYIDSWQHGMPPPFRDPGHMHGPQGMRWSQGYRMEPSHPLHPHPMSTPWRPGHPMREGSPSLMYSRYDDGIIEGIMPPPQSSERALCKFFQTGSCTKGSECTFVHELNTEQPSGVHIPEHLRDKFYEQVTRTVRRDASATSTPLRDDRTEASAGVEENKKGNAAYFPQQPPMPQQQGQEYYGENITATQYQPPLHGPPHLSEEYRYYHDPLADAGYDGLHNAYGCREYGDFPRYYDKPHEAPYHIDEHRMPPLRSVELGGM